MKGELIHVSSVQLFIICLFNIFLYCHNKDSWRLTLKKWYKMCLIQKYEHNSTTITQTEKKITSNQGNVFPKKTPASDVELLV